jgi:RNA polymerase sigma-70 factor (ECF subfamily)
LVLWILTLAEDDITIDERTHSTGDATQKWVQELPDQYRLVFSLYVLDGYSHKEIAEILKCCSTTKSNLARANNFERKINSYR